MKNNLKYILFIIVVLSLIIVFKFNNIKADSLFLLVNDENEISKDITLTIDLSSIDYDNFTFKLSSSESLETLDSENVELNTSQEEISFDYCINCSNLDKIVLTYKLPSNINVGNKITFYAEVINKNNTEEVTTLRKVVSIIEDKTKENDNKEESDKTSKDGKIYNQTNERKNNMTIRLSNSRSNTKSSFNTKKVTYNGSDNNYLKSLSIKNYKFNRNFSKDGLTYFTTVKNNITSLKVTASSESDKAKVTITGNSGFKVGINKILINVTSESGKSRTYRIYVTREEA